MWKESLEPCKNLWNIWFQSYHLSSLTNSFLIILTDMAGSSVSGPSLSDEYWDHRLILPVLLRSSWMVEYGKISMQNDCFPD